MWKRWRLMSLSLDGRKVICPHPHQKSRHCPNLNLSHQGNQPIGNHPLWICRQRRHQLKPAMSIADVFALQMMFCKPLSSSLDRLLSCTTSAWFALANYRGILRAHLLCRHRLSYRTAGQSALCLFRPKPGCALNGSALPWYRQPNTICPMHFYQ